MIKPETKTTLTKEKKAYHPPVLELICFENEDVITTSGGLQVIDDVGADEFDWGVYYVD